MMGWYKYVFAVDMYIDIYPTIHPYLILNL